jgi:hypothetical protein
LWGYSDSNCQIDQAFAGIVWTDYPLKPELSGKGILLEASKVFMTFVLDARCD